MDFALNDEQQMLQESARRFFSERHPLSRAREALPWSDAAQQTLWADMAAMGWMGLLVPESHDGLGLGLCEAFLVAEAAGQQLLNLPWASSAVLLPLWLKASHAPPAALLDWVQAAAQGERAFHCSPASSQWQDYALQASDVIAVQGWHDDSLPLRLGLQTGPRQTGPHQTAPGALDGTQAIAALAPSAAKEWLTLDLSPQARAQARAAYRLALVGELIGAGQASLQMARNYACERVQFGKPIGSYQAIKHQLANAWMAMDNARLAALYAAAALDGDLPDWRFACAAAELTAIEGAQQTTRTSIQVLGGMGFTWEHDAHLYLKRVQHVATRLGGASRALSQLEALAC